MTARRKSDDADDVRAACSMAVLTAREQVAMRSMFAVVNCIADLDRMEALLAERPHDYAVSVHYDPRLIDACCVRGIFPMALHVGYGMFLFMAKLHTVQAICALTSSDVHVGDTCIAALKSLRVRRRFARRGAAVDGVRTMYRLYMNRTSDVPRVFALIVRVHSENWFCTPLRTCLAYMLAHPDAFAARIVVTAVWRCELCDGDDDAQCVDRELVAGEVGYVVSDMYTSMTGACTESGSGRAQLAATAAAMRALGVTIWDLGMPLPYKSTMLACSHVPRAVWLELVRTHRARRVPTADATLSYDALAAGVELAQLVCA